MRNMRNFLGKLPTVPKDCEQWRVVPQLVARGQNIVSGLTKKAVGSQSTLGKTAIFSIKLNNSVKPRSI